MQDTAAYTFDIGRQAVYRQAKKKGLARYLRSKPSHCEVNRILKLLAGIARLPAQRVEEGFKAVREEAKLLQGRVRRKVERLLSYFERQWIKKYTAEELSIWGKGVHASSGQESVNARVNSMTAARRQTFWDFVSKYSFHITTTSTLEI